MSAIISTMTAQQWGLLNQPELQAFQKMYDEELLSEGIVFFPVALERYYAKLGMSKTEFSFMRSLLQLWAKNDKKSWFAQEQIEELFGKSRRQVQRDARKLAKEGFIIISEWDDLNNGGTHCIYYDCTPFLQMISQLVRVHRHRNTLIEDISIENQAHSASTANRALIQESATAVQSSQFSSEKGIPVSPLPATTVSDAGAPSVTIVSIKSNHIHMTRGKKLSNASFADMYDPSYAEPIKSEQPSRQSDPGSRQSIFDQSAIREPITALRLATQKASEKLAASTLPYKMVRAQLPPPPIQQESSYQKPKFRSTSTRPASLQGSAQVSEQRDKTNMQPSPMKHQDVVVSEQLTSVPKTPIPAMTPAERERNRQKNQQQTRLPLLSSVIMREVSQAFHDDVPQASQQDAAIIFRRLLLINRIQDDLSIENPDQYFANLIKNVFQHLLATDYHQSEMRAGANKMDSFMDELNHAAFSQFEQIKILRHQRMQTSSLDQREADAHAAQQPRPIQIAAQETISQFDQSSIATMTSMSHVHMQPGASNFPVGEELVALAHHMHISMTAQEANEIERGTASEQLLLDIQHAILLSYSQQPDLIANVNYA